MVWLQAARFTAGAGSVKWLPSAADAVPGLLPHRLITIEGLDARLPDVVRREGWPVPDLPACGGWLFVELDTAGAAVVDAINPDRLATLTGLALLTAWQF